MKTLYAKLWLAAAICLAAMSATAQDDDLLSLLGEEETTTYTTASFKTNRVINFHSLESTAAGVFDMKISHRFGMLNQGAYDLFGLDNATIRIGGDYGITNWLTVGVGRSSFQKTYDGFIKVKLLRQSSGQRNMPITLALLSTGAIQTMRWADPDRDNFFSSRLYYAHQMIVGRKFSDKLTLQISPTVVHRNLVKTTAEANDVWGIGAAGRLRLNRRIAINGEYMYVLPNQLASEYYNSLSIGFDIETGGHVFQLHFTNSTSMIEKGFIAETTGNWLDGDIHFGFNVSRVFTVKKHR
jgi:hypothetical protein